MKLKAAGVSLLSLLVLLSACAGPSKTDKFGRKKLDKREKARLYVEMANSDLLASNPESALKNILKAEALESDLPELHHTKALAFYAKDRRKDALTAAQRAVALNPAYSQANTTLGKLLIDQKKYRLARPPLLRAAKDPTYREAFKARTLLGVMYYRQNRLSDSELELGLAIKDDPARACVAHYYQGHVHLKRKAFKNAIKSYELASKDLCSNFAQAHFALGLALDRGGDKRLAKKKYLEIQKLFPKTQIAKRAMDKLKRLP